MLNTIQKISSKYRQKIPLWEIIDKIKNLEHPNSLIPRKINISGIFRLNTSVFYNNCLKNSAVN